MNYYKLDIGSYLYLTTNETLDYIATNIVSSLLTKKTLEIVPLMLGAPGVGKSDTSRRALVIVVKALITAFYDEILEKLQDVIDSDGYDIPIEVIKTELEKDKNMCQNNEVCSHLAEIIKKNSDLEKMIPFSIVDFTRALVRTLVLTSTTPEAQDPETLFVARYESSVNSEKYSGCIVYVGFNVSSSSLLKLTGLPYIDEITKTTKTFPPDWAKVLRQSFLAVFNIDEVTNEMDEERLALLYSMLLDRMVGEYKFGHPRVFVVGTGNTAKTSSLVGTLPAPLFTGRFSPILIKRPTVSEWINYMNEVYGNQWFRPIALILKFLSDDLGSLDKELFSHLKKGLFEGYGDIFLPPDEVLVELSSITPGDTPPFPSPRAWTKVALTLYQLKKIGVNNPKVIKGTITSLTGLSVISDIIYRTYISSEVDPSLSSAEERVKIILNEYKMPEDYYKAIEKKINKILEKITKINPNDLDATIKLLDEYFATILEIYFDYLSFAVVLDRKQGDEATEILEWFKQLLELVNEKVHREQSIAATILYGLVMVAVPSLRSFLLVRRAKGKCICKKLLD